MPKHRHTHQQPPPEEDGSSVSIPPPPLDSGLGPALTGPVTSVSVGLVEDRMLPDGEIWSGVMLTIQTAGGSVLTVPLADPQGRFFITCPCPPADGTGTG